ncbi:MAG: hypothetical protein ACQER7_15220 [Bacteroidota bacterium]
MNVMIQARINEARSLEKPGEKDFQGAAMKLYISGDFQFVRLINAYQA